MKTEWQRAKRGRIEAALRFLNDERTLEGPTLAKFDNRDFLYPHNWQHLASMDADFDPYVYWRW